MQPYILVYLDLCIDETCSESIETEAVFYKAEINKEWKINFLQYSLFYMQHTYSSEFTRSLSTSKNSSVDTSASQKFCNILVTWGTIQQLWILMWTWKTTLDCEMLNSPNTLWVLLTRFASITWNMTLKSTLWIELPQPKNPANTCVWHMETLDGCFDLIKSHQQCIPWSPPLEIKPATTECRAETLQLSHQSTSYTSDAQPTSHGNCTAN